MHSALVKSQEDAPESQSQRAPAFPPQTPENASHASLRRQRARTESICVRFRPLHMSLRMNRRRNRPCVSSSGDHDGHSLREESIAIENLRLQNCRPGCTPCAQQCGSMLRSRPSLPKFARRARGNGLLMIHKSRSEGCGCGEASPSHTGGLWVVAEVFSAPIVRSRRMVQLNCFLKGAHHVDHLKWSYGDGNRIT